MERHTSTDMLVQAWLPRAAARNPDAPAVVAGGRTLRYADLAAEADAAARRLHARGARAGDRVAIALPPGADFAVALHGCLRLGAVAVPVDLRLGDEERAARAATCAVTVDAPLDGPEGDAPLVATHDLDAVAAVIHTSGTTGTGRAIELTFGNWLWSALGSAVALGLDPRERWLSALPLAHVGGLSILLRSSIYATTAVIHPAFDLDAALEELSRATLVSLVPTQLSRLLGAGLHHPPRLRMVLLGGGPIPPVLLERAREAGVPVVSTYGLTEACSQVTTGGHPLFCTHVELAPDGEILVGGPTVAPGSRAEDGLLHTGDLGAWGEDGELRITGRAADTIVTGGENVAPAEVEAVLEAHPAVSEAAVHGRPDPEWGEAVVATVVLADGAHASEEELRAHVRERLAGFKAPKQVGFADALPRTPSGKLLRRLLA
jgi:O-succinylbenzoic acid--CoA ligase